MTEGDPPRELVEGLIAQDPGISDLQLKEFRMNLERSLEELERRAQSSRRATIRSVVAVVVCYVFGFVLRTTQEFGGLPSYIVLPIWSVCTWIALITAAVLVGRYWSTHRPALDRGRIDLQIAMFGELQQQISSINRRLDDRAKA